MNWKLGKFNRRNNGIVLILTIIVLVVMSAMLYTVGSRLSRKVHRNQYIIDYQNARYACDSATKYALAVIDELKPDPIERPNEPDFSDLYRTSSDEYDRILEEYKLEIGYDANLVDANWTDPNAKMSNVMREPQTLSFAQLLEKANKDEPTDSNLADFNEPNATGNFSSGMFGGDSLEDIYIRGPYGPRWPLVKEPINFEIGDCTVTIEIEDENAKLPATWALIKDEKYNRQAQAAVKSFFEWMQLNPSEIETLQKEFDQIKEIKVFSVDLKAPKITTKTTKEVQPAAQKTSRRSRRARRSRASRARTKTVTKSTERAMNLHLTDFSKIMNSSTIDTQILQKPVIESPDRVESAYKYLGLWGSHQVNINTAPRHVLEAAFSFGGDEAAIADEIIRLRRIKPFESIEELAKTLYRYNDTIEKSKPYIITRSNLFTVKITASCGTAKASAVAAVLKEEKSVEKIALILK